VDRWPGSRAAGRRNGIDAGRLSCASCGRLANRRQEQSRRDGEHANPDWRQLARDRQRHRDDAALRGRIRPTVRSDLIGSDDAVEITTPPRLSSGSASTFPGRQPQHVEEPIRLTRITCRNQRAAWAIAADHPFCHSDAGAIHQYPRGPWALEAVRWQLPQTRRRRRRRQQRHLRFRRRRFRELGIEVPHGNAWRLRSQRRALRRPSRAPPVTMAA